MTGSGTTQPCWCCGTEHAARSENDPWDGRLAGYCERCAWARCDAYPGECPVKGTPATPRSGFGI